LQHQKHANGKGSFEEKGWGGGGGPAGPLKGLPPKTGRFPPKEMKKKGTRGRPSAPVRDRACKRVTAKEKNLKQGFLKAKSREFFRGMLQRSNCLWKQETVGREGQKKSSWGGMKKGECSPGLVRQARNTRGGKKRWHRRGKIILGKARGEPKGGLTWKNIEKKRRQVPKSPKIPFGKQGN